MKQNKIEEVKAEVLTLSYNCHRAQNELSNMVASFQYMATTLEKLVVVLDELQNQQKQSVDLEDPQLIEEWVDTYGYDFEQYFSDAVDVELEATGYGDELTINSCKEVCDVGRNDTLRKAIEMYLQWAKGQKETQAEEDTTNG